MKKYNNMNKMKLNEYLKWEYRLVLLNITQKLRHLIKIFFHVIRYCMSANYHFSKNKTCNFGILRRIRKNYPKCGSVF